GSNFAATQEDLARLIALIRLLVISNKPWVQDTFEVKRKDFTFLVCLVEPPIKKYKAKGKTKRMGYREIAYIVLAEADRPLPWREIEERARKLNKKERFKASSLYSALISHKNLFISDGQGTYKLVKLDEGGREREERSLAQAGHGTGDGIQYPGFFRMES
ncbi:MAG: winged helix-turn-helix domain-containing protein, partial [Anaerolineae bacterium]|nr:winged helix-turn-helix domain-containing protein [Anaerolineae bacterium]MCI0609432.1 winged helix-turn-helix domain-containing protein [Anaerolineae bacterium]